MKVLIVLSVMCVALTYGLGYGIGAYLYEVGGIITAYADPVNQFDIDFSNGQAIAPNYQLQPAISLQPAININ